MARKYEGVLDEWVEYIPDVWGERALAETRPGECIRMQIKYMTRKLRKKHEMLFRKAMRSGGVLDDADAESVKLIFAEHVKDIVNVDDPDTGNPIVTGEDLAECGETPLTIDVLLAIVNRSALEAGLAKKFVSP